jgi:hypothetical protein
LLLQPQLKGEMIMSVPKTLVLSVSMVLFIAGVMPETISAAQCPCDIYAAGGTPCVSAHSTVRALYGAYNGPLYQVTRKSDKKTKDIGLRTPGGLVNAAVQDSFLAGTAGHITIIYDQSANANHLTPAPTGAWLPADTPALASNGAIMLNGFTVHGVYVDGKFPTSRSDTLSKAVGYRNNRTTGMPKGNEPEGMYMVVDAKRYSPYCCFDYGNAGTSNNVEGNGTMEALYFGNWGSMGHGAGVGPWILADFENGLFGGALNVDTNTKTITNVNFVMGMLKGDTINRFVLKAFDAQSGVSKSLYDGRRPIGYYPMKKSGAVILGIGGDNSHGGWGTFFEGAITRGFPSDATENAVLANIVTAGYGQTTTATLETGFAGGNAASLFMVDYSAQKGNVVIGYTLGAARKVSVRVFDLRGRPIAAIDDGVKAPGRHTAVWHARRAHAGIYVCCLSIDGIGNRAEKIIMGNRPR